MKRVAILGATQIRIRNFIFFLAKKIVFASKIENRETDQLRNQITLNVVILVRDTLDPEMIAGEAIYTPCGPK